MWATFAWVGCGRADNFVVLETAVGGGDAAVVAGEPALADSPACPASTFKLVIALAALEEGIATPSSRHRCGDVSGPVGQREIDMCEAMRHSSNEYFLWLAARLGTARIAERAIRVGFVGGPVAEDWVGEDAAAVVRGGSLRVTPRQLHTFTVRLMRGGVTSGPAGQRMMEDVMAWPSQDPGVRVFGKTGTWGGAAWYTGFVERAGARKATTVLVGYEVPAWGPARERAIRLFYERAGVRSPETPKNQRTLQDLNLRPSDP